MKLIQMADSIHKLQEKLQHLQSKVLDISIRKSVGKEGQSYQELEAIVRSEVGKTLLDNRKLLQNALVSIVVALRNEPDKYLLIDRMELTPFTTNSIINYNSFLALRRPPIPQGNEQFVSGRVLEMAERVLNNLQKGIVDSTISTAAGLEKGSLYSGTYQALPYYEFPSHLPRYFNPDSIEANESSNNGDEAARIAYNDGHYIRR